MTTSSFISHWACGGAAVALMASVNLDAVLENIFKLRFKLVFRTEPNSVLGGVLTGIEEKENKENKTKPNIRPFTRFEPEELTGKFKFS